MKRISQIDQDLDKAQEQLGEANNKLEEANKKSADVSVQWKEINVDGRGAFCFFFLLQIKKKLKP
jgi:F0F1-type ATP synthase membrane subunit b/b'